MSPATARPQYAREIRHGLTDPYALCAALGFIKGKGSFVRQAGGISVRCPWHDDRTPSCSVRIGKDGTIAVRCHGCNATGDALSLVARVRGLSIKSDFRAVLIAAAEIAGMHGIVHEIEGGKIVDDRPRFVPPPPSTEPDRDYPPPAEIAEVFAIGTTVSDDVEAAAMLCERGIDPEAVDAADVAAVLPKTARLPRWARYRGRSWIETGHRLIVPMRSATGVLTSVRAWRVTAGETPKRLPPTGHRASALVMACQLGTAFLAGTLPSPRVIITEGEPDFVVAATWRLRRPTACLGVVSGSWTPALAARFVAGQEVLVWTDRDRAGDVYASEIAKSLLPRGVRVGRWKPESST